MIAMRAVLFASLLLAIPAAVAADHVPDGEATVVAVVDGDTIDVRAADSQVYRVRYIGIDTPETRHPTRGAECYGPEASARNRELVLGATVYLELVGHEIRASGERLVCREPATGSLYSVDRPQEWTVKDEEKHVEEMKRILRAQDAG